MLAFAAKVSFLSILIVLGSAASGAVAPAPELESGQCHQTEDDDTAFIQTLSSVKSGRVETDANSTAPQKSATARANYSTPENARAESQACPTITASVLVALANSGRKVTAIQQEVKVKKQESQQNGTGMHRLEDENQEEDEDEDEEELEELSPWEKKLERWETMESLAHVLDEMLDEKTKRAIALRTSERMSQGRKDSKSMPFSLRRRIISLPPLPISFPPPPSIPIPPISIPDIHLPDIPSLPVPDINIPDIDLPFIDLPDFTSLSTFMPDALDPMVQCLDSLPSKYHVTNVFRFLFDSTQNDGIAGLGSAFFEEYVRPPLDQIQDWAHSPDADHFTIQTTTYDTKDGRGMCPDGDVLATESEINTEAQAQQRCGALNCASYSWSNDPNDQHYTAIFCTADRYDQADESLTNWKIGRPVSSSTSHALIQTAWNRLGEIANLPHFEVFKCAYDHILEPMFDAMQPIILSRMVAIENAFITAWNRIVDIGTTGLIGQINNRLTNRWSTFSDQFNALAEMEASLTCERRMNTSSELMSAFAAGDMQSAARIRDIQSVEGDLEEISSRAARAGTRALLNDIRKENVNPMVASWVNSLMNTFGQAFYAIEGLCGLIPEAGAAVCGLVLVAARQGLDASLGSLTERAIDIIFENLQRIPDRAIDEMRGFVTRYLEDGLTLELEIPGLPSLFHPIVTFVQRAITESILPGARGIARECDAHFHSLRAIVDSVSANSTSRLPANSTSSSPAPVSANSSANSSANASLTQAA